MMWKTARPEVLLICAPAAWSVSVKLKTPDMASPKYCPACLLCLSHVGRQHTWACHREHHLAAPLILTISSHTSVRMCDIASASCGFTPHRGVQEAARGGLTGCLAMKGRAHRVSGYEGQRRDLHRLKVCPHPVLVLDDALHA